MIASAISIGLKNKLLGVLNFLLIKSLIISCTGGCIGDFSFAHALKLQTNESSSL
jgi:hypothetical protein